MQSLIAEIGLYSVIRQIGSGGMGVVLEAVHKQIERRVAIKLLHPHHAQNSDAAERLFREALAVNRIEHPSIVQISEHGQLPDGAMYLVMELLRGQTLAAWLKQNRGPAPVRMVLSIAAQVASGLAAAHEKGIIHRDIKPGNLMLLEDATCGVDPAVPVVKILDFGIAKFSSANDAGAASKTGTNFIMGTPQYMSPEQCQGAGFVDTKSDVYSLGVVLFQLLAGRRPFEAPGCGQLIALHLLQDPPLLRELVPTIPDRLAEVVQSMLAKDKQARPTMRELQGEFARMLNGPAADQGFSPATAVHEPVPTVLAPFAAAATQRRTGRTGPTPQRRRAVVWLIAGGLLTAAAGVGLHFNPQGKTAEPQAAVLAGSNATGAVAASNKDPLQGVYGGLATPPPPTAGPANGSASAPQPRAGSSQGSMLTSAGSSQTSVDVGTKQKARPLIHLGSSGSRQRATPHHRPQVNRKLATRSASAPDRSSGTPSTFPLED